jgi:hypothetical protein
MLYCSVALFDGGFFTGDVLCIFLLGAGAAGTGSFLRTLFFAAGWVVVITLSALLVLLPLPEDT